MIRRTWVGGFSSYRSSQGAKHDRQRQQSNSSIVEGCCKPTWVVVVGEGGQREIAARYTPEEDSRDCPDSDNYARYKGPGRPPASSPPPRVLSHSAPVV